MRDQPLVTASAALAHHHPDCVGAFVAGSVMRGEDTPTSDIDIVVLYDDSFEDVHRSSMVHDNWPIEFFVQNTEAQRYFLEKDRQRGMCVLADMVANGVMLPGPALILEQRRDEAQRIIAEGPPVLSVADRDRRRYAITNLIDDLQGASEVAIKNAVLAELHDEVADFTLRCRQQWSGHGKSMLRSLKLVDEQLHDRFVQAFERGFASVTAEAPQVMELVDELLAPEGGRLWEGYTERAHPGWLPDRSDTEE